MRIFLTGVEGALGSELVKHLDGHRVMAPLENELDLRNFPKVVAWVRDFKPEVICHLAAISDVDGCEQNKALANAVNVQGTYAVATGANLTGAKIFYISTNYVFDGNHADPYYESDQPSPLNEYGRTKLQGEVVIRDLTHRHFIVRTSWLFGRKSKTFASRLIETDPKPKEAKVIIDQFGCFTYTKDLSAGLARLLNTDYFGIYHLVNRGKASWYDFLKHARQQLRFDTVITPVNTADLKLSAPRPVDAELGSRCYEAVFGESMRSWPEALDDFITSLR